MDAPLTPSSGIMRRDGKEKTRWDSTTIGAYRGSFFVRGCSRK